MNEISHIHDQGAIHLVTFTVHQWVDVITEQDYIDILLESILFCQQEKGLEVYAWVVMSNYCDLIVRAKKNDLSDIIRDCKKFTFKKIYHSIRENEKEKRKVWLLMTLMYKEHIWFWNEGYKGEEILTNELLLSKRNYLHLSSGWYCRKA